ncbi:MAG: helix-hairpin-helix domain-containing protein [Prevotellaceae bacterium]|nr:helix-hairpin-helix domain-containing protein [Candidatus Minthosoma caballi]
MQKGQRRAVLALGSIAVFSLGVVIIADSMSNQQEQSMANEKSEALGSVRKDVSEKQSDYSQNRKNKKEYAYPLRNEREGEHERSEHHEYKSNKFQSLTVVDVNAADSALLTRIPGVGEKISAAIIRYRTKLGGYHDVNQLLDISIVSPELLEWFTADAAAVKQIDVNTASFQELNSHPYITYEQTKAIMRHRRLYGKFEGTEDLQASGIFTSEELERVLAYIVFQK